MAPSCLAHLSFQTANTVSCIIPWPKVQNLISSQLGSKSTYRWQVYTKKDHSQQIKHKNKSDGTVLDVLYYQSHNLAHKSPQRTPQSVKQLHGKSSIYMLVNCHIIPTWPCCLYAFWPCLLRLNRFFQKCRRYFNNTESAVTSANSLIS